jgi:hypothetical protein
MENSNRLINLDTQKFTFLLIEVDDEVSKISRNKFLMFKFMTVHSLCDELTKHEFLERALGLHPPGMSFMIPSLLFSM